jgi:formamidopyrimidine-DNA glycosylase
MPELPEVEIAARNLKRWMRGKTIERVVVRTSRVIRGGTPKAITAAIEGRSVKSVDRRGKWLRIVLDDGTRVFSHFGMSGRFVRRAIDDETERSERARFDLAKVTNEHASIRYVDPRMFGRLVVAKDDIDAWTSLGPDPLVDGIDVERLAALLARKKRSIKETLLDQAVLAGVGNIQATEALWHARVDPRRKSSTLTKPEVRALAKGIDRSIADTLAHETGPEITYVEDAGAPNPFIVYGRGGDPCPRCKTPLTRMVLGGRGTVYCGKCQR